MIPPGTEAGIKARIERAAARSLAWLGTMAAPGTPRGVCRISAAHDPEAWPGMLLPGTYNAVMCADLLGGLGDYTSSERGALLRWLEACRRPDGVFRIAGMRDTDVYKKPDRAETWRYIDFHVTNYALGAVDALEPGRPARLEFARPWLEPQFLKAWLADRDLRDPWQEGNNIVNLGGFLLLLERDGDAATRAAVARAFDVLFDWHDRLQEPGTGFWGVGQATDATRLLHAFAGSMHNYHLWYARGRQLPCQARAADYVLGRSTAVHSACIDVDEIDLLVHADRLTAHRRDDVRGWLAAKLAALLDAQNDDGGFPDETSGIRRQDGWVRGYAEPQGLSNTFSTWFRWIAIGLAVDHLWPGWRTWRFRRSVGIGYRMPG